MEPTEFETRLRALVDAYGLRAKAPPAESEIVALVAEYRAVRAAIDQLEGERDRILEAVKMAKIGNVLTSLRNATGMVKRLADHLENAEDTPLTRWGIEAIDLVREARVLTSTANNPKVRKE